MLLVSESITETIRSAVDVINTPQLYGMTIAASLILLPLIILISSCLNYVSSFIAMDGDRIKFLDMTKVKKDLIRAIFIPIIPPILTMFYGIAIMVSEYMGMDSTELNNSLSSFIDVIWEMPEEDFDILNLSTSTIVKFLATVMMFLALLLILLAKIIILLFSSVFVKFCIIVSPLALTFSILNILKDQINKLIQVFLNACFVSLTLNILDRMFFESILNQIIPSLLSTPQIDMYNYILVTGVCITIVIFYLLSIWLTSKYVGSPGAASVLTMATTVATITSAAIIKNVGKFLGSKVAGAASTVSGGGNNVLGNTASTIADNINKENG